MKKQLLLFSFEDEFTKNFLKTISETQKEEIRRALKEIIMRYFDFVGRMLYFPCLQINEVQFHGIYLFFLVVE